MAIAPEPVIAELLSTVNAWADSALRELSVAVVYGGVSAEDRLYISKSPAGQLSITALSETLTQLGVRYEVLDPCRSSFIRDVAGFDMALPNLHGPFGEDGRLQGLLDYLRVPCCGSSVAASAIAADKVLCKRHMEALGIPTPAWRTWPGPTAAWAGRPVMVKARMGGSSVGMSLVRREEDLDAAIQNAEFSDPLGALIEDHVQGLPITVGMLELPSRVVVFPPLATEVRAAEFYDADAKLDAADEGTVRCSEALLPTSAAEAVNDYVLKLWDGLGCRGMARVDFIVADDGGIYGLEVNTTPGMSRESNYVTGAALLGLTLADILLAVLREAHTRRRYDVPLPVPDFSGRPT